MAGVRILTMPFGTDMVRALLDGRKSVTRQIVEFPANYNPKWTGYIPDGSVLYGSNNIPAAKSPYRPGDILHIQEAWSICDNLWDGTDMIIYRASYNGGQNSNIKWHPSIHMPKEAARIFLRVTGVRVERLQDITVDGALHEGTPDVEPPPICQNEISYPESFPKGFDKWDEARWEEWIQSTARARYIGWCDYADKLLKKFGSIWNSTIKPADRAMYGWAANPWVWVIEFERCEKPDEFGH